MALLTPVEPQAHTRTVAILCLVAALLFWMSVKLSREYATELQVPLRYQLPAGLTFSQTPPGTLTVSVDGTGWQILARQLRGGREAVIVDSAQIKSAGGNGIPVLRPVERAFAKTPLSVRRVAPERITPTTSQVSSRRLPVALQSEISYAESFAGRQKPVLVPDSVVVTGPVAILRNLKEWPTDSLRLANVRDTLTLRLTLAAAEAVRVQPSSVRVQITGQQVAERRLIVPVVAIDVPAGDSVSLVPETVEVRAIVGLSDHSRLRPSDFRCEVSVAGVDFTDAPARLPVRVEEEPSYVRRSVLKPGAVTVYRVRRGR